MKDTSRIASQSSYCLIIVTALVLPGQIQAQDEYERVLVQFKPQGDSINAGSPAHAIPNAQVHREFAELNVAASQRARLSARRPAQRPQCGGGPAGHASLPHR